MDLVKIVDTIGIRVFADQEILLMNGEIILTKNARLNVMPIQIAQLSFSEKETHMCIQELAHYIQELLIVQMETEVGLVIPNLAGEGNHSMMAVLMMPLGQMLMATLVIGMLIIKTLVEITMMAVAMEQLMPAVLVKILMKLTSETV